MAPPGDTRRIVQCDFNVKPSNPWRTLASSLKYGNKWFSVREDDVIRPDGQRGTYSVVTAERIATGIVPLWPDDTVTLVGQFRYAVNEYSWEIPEGGGPLDVDPLETARRELREEAGLTAGTWLFLGRVHTSNCFVNEVCHVYLATELSEVGARPDPEEVLQTQRVAFDRAIEMTCDGSITDAITIAGLCWAALKRSPSAARRR
jgi:8-oxo-dGTP pyrophosphatase MutT (NUDIX family)